MWTAALKIIEKIDIIEVIALNSAKPKIPSAGDQVDLKEHIHGTRGNAHLMKDGFIPAPFFPKRIP